MKKVKMLVALLALPLFSYAWDSSGHNMGGALAYYYLKSHGKTDVIDKVVAALKKHPWFNDPKHWKGKLTGLTAERKKVALFMLASTYPDDAKKAPGIEGSDLKRKWHYIDIPFVPVGQDVTGLPPLVPNAEIKIQDMIDSIPHTTAATQAVQLCWLFHLIEDIHQPLHAAQLFDENHKAGDGGGNATFIKTPGAGDAKKLHSFWDGLISGTLTNIPAKAQGLLANPEYAETNLTELTTNTTVNAWLNLESFPIAKDSVYKNGTIAGTSAAPAPVDSKYIDAAKEIAERRIVLAGIRLAKQLEQLF